MNAWKIALIVIFSIGILATVASLGKPRRPLTPGVAATVVAIGAFEIVAVVLA